MPRDLQPGEALKLSPQFPSLPELRGRSSTFVAVCRFHAKKQIGRPTLVMDPSGNLAADAKNEIRGRQRA